MVSVHILNLTPFLLENSYLRGLENWFSELLAACAPVATPVHVINRASEDDKFLVQNCPGKQCLLFAVVESGWKRHVTG